LKACKAWVAFLHLHAHQRECEAPAEPPCIAITCATALRSTNGASTFRSFPHFTASKLAILALLALLAITLLCGCRPDSSRPGTTAAAPSGTPTARASVQTTPDPRSNPASSAATKDPPTPLSPIRFRTLGPESGFSFTRFDDQRGQWRILEANGGGVAVLDIDLDCWPDVFLTNGCRIPLDPTDRRTPGQLFRNRSDLKFQNVSTVSGLEQFGLGYGCAVADADEDGFDDLYLTRFGGNQFWHNNGDGTFTEIAAANGTLSGDWGSGAAFADLNRDGWQDLYVVNYLAESDTSPRLCAEPASPTGFIGCSPALFEGVADRIYLADGSGGYVDASAAAGLEQLRGKGLGVVICDLDGDHRSEIYVANDGEANFLFTVDVTESAPGQVPGVRLTDRALHANAALNEQGYAQASMGIAVGDLDNNSQTDLFLTHFYGDTNTVYLNQSTPGQLSFRDATRASALGPPSRRRLGFGTVAADFDGDGWDDIFVANGHVDDRSWMQGGQPFRMQAQLFINQQARFSDVSASAGDWFQDPWLGRGAATADFNQDGRLDIVVSCQLDPAVILINEFAATSAAAQKDPLLALLPLSHTGTRTPWGLKITDSVLNAVVELHPGESFQSACSRELLLPCTSEGTTFKVRWPAGDVIDMKSPMGQYFWLAERGLYPRKH
jgi:hypothetical protein